jgi:hypothetical protein
MRRYTFYLSVALLAFGIGSFVVFKFYWKAENVSPKVEQINETNVFMKRFGDARSDLKREVMQTPIENQPLVKKKTNLTCNDKILSTVLADLKKEKDFNNDVKYYLEENNASDCKDILFIKKTVDLNNDGIDEVIVRGKNWLLCGATGNCSTWIYGKFGKKYKKLLDTGGETLEVKKKSKNGYKNIFVSVHDSCCSSYLQTYKFDGAKYKEGNCLFEDYGTTGERMVMTCAEKTKQSQERESELKLNNQ